MDKATLEALIEENLSTTKIGKRLNMSQTNVRYWLRKHGLNTKTVSNKGKMCITCGAALGGRRTHYCSKLCKGEHYTNNPNDYITQKERALARKKHLIELKGGCCEICGYKKNYAGLLFHHNDPQNKSFTLDSRKCSNTRMSSLLLELAKCRLLCHNCHSELHHPNLNIE